MILLSTLKTVFKRIQAFFLAILMFFSAPVYADEPTALDFTTEIKLEKILPNEIIHETTYTCRVCVTVTNIGEPYKGSTHDYPHIYIYRYVDGERKPLPYASAGSDDEPREVLVNSGDVRTFASSLWINQGYEPGEYTVEVKVRGCDKVYTETITLE